jgi:hypothetical protein
MKYWPILFQSPRRWEPSRSVSQPVLAFSWDAWPLPINTPGSTDPQCWAPWWPSLYLLLLSAHCLFFYLRSIFRYSQLAAGETYIARLSRASMLEVLTQDFVRTARAKGLPESQVVYKHALRVAILPVVSFLGPLAANLLTGSIVVESIFSIPGAGGFFVNSVLNRDGFLLAGVVIVYCALLVLFNLLVDILYGVLDRRIILYD